MWNWLFWFDYFWDIFTAWETHQYWYILHLCVWFIGQESQKGGIGRLPFGRCHFLGILACPARWCQRFGPSAWWQRSRDSARRSRRTSQINRLQSSNEKIKRGNYFTRSPNSEVEARPHTFLRFVPDITLFRISKMLEGSNKKPPHCPCSLFWVYVVTPADCVHG